jgi:hypothetical protein
MARKFYTYKRDVPKLKPGQRIDFLKGHGYFVVPTRPKKPIPIPPRKTPDVPLSMFSAPGVFCTSDTSTAHGYLADWVAVQVDPEGDPNVGNLPGIECWWMARPTEERLDVARHRLIPFIGQAENEAELQVCLDLGRGGLNIPHALVGNPGAWSPEGAKEAAEQGWDLILEWYWNNTPSYTSPNADNYPLFRNVCFGTFPSETVPGRRVYVDEYRAVWAGPYSIWDTENATGRDRAAYNKP